MVLLILLMVFQSEFKPFRRAFLTDKQSLTITNLSLVLRAKFVGWRKGLRFSCKFTHFNPFLGLRIDFLACESAFYLVNPFFCSWICYSCLVYVCLWLINLFFARKAYVPLGGKPVSKYLLGFVVQTIADFA